MSSSCSRQGYKPTLVIPSGIVIDSLATEPAFEGMIGNSTTFPFFQDNTPATAEFRQAAAAFGAGVTMGVGTATGWTAGKLLERAAVSFPGRPTSESLLRGLWSIRNDDLGGITAPLSFTENQPATASACWFTTK